MRSKRKTRRRTLIRTGLAAATLAAVYALAGFMLAPRLVGRLLDGYAAQAAGRVLEVGHIAVNPFRLSVVLEHVAFSDPEANIEIAADRAEVNFSVAALSGRRITLDALTLDRPRGRIAGGAAAGGVGGLLDRWTARLGALSPPARVGRLRVAAGQLDLDTADALSLSDVALTIAHLATDADTPATYTLSLAEGGGIGLRSQGQFDIAVPSAEGQLELTGFDLRRLRSRRPGAIPASGVLALSGAFRIAGPAGDGTTTFNDATLEIRDLTWPMVRGAAAAAASLTADFTGTLRPVPDGIDIEGQFGVDGSEVSLADGAADPSELRLEHLRADARLVFDPDRIDVDGSLEGDGAVLARMSDPDAALSAAHLTADRLSVAGAPLTIAIDDLRLEGLSARVDLAPSSPRLPAWLRLPVGRAPAPPAGAAVPWRIRLEQVELADASFALTDRRLGPDASILWHGVNGDVLAARDPGMSGRVALDGAVGDAGAARITGRVPPAGSAESSRFELDAERLPASLFSPYALRFAGRTLRRGTLSGEFTYGVDVNRPEGSIHLVASDLALGPARADAGAALSPPLPLALTAALLEDPSGRLELSAPLTAALGPRDADPAAIFGSSLAAAIARTAARPFDALGGAIGASAAALSPLPFEPGSAEITGAASMQLDRLAAALAQRPGVALSVAGGFDRAADREALAAQQIRLHVALATAGATDFAPAQFGEPPPVDFASPRAQDVLDEFAGERLGAERVRTIAARFPAAASEDPTERRDYYRALFAALVAREPIEDAALTRLGRYRAQAIVAALGRHDLGAARLKLTGSPTPVTASGAVVLVPLGVAALEDETAAP